MSSWSWTCGTYLTRCLECRKYPWVHPRPGTLLHSSARSFSRRSRLGRVSLLNSMQASIHFFSTSISISSLASISTTSPSPPWERRSLLVTYFSTSPGHFHLHPRSFLRRSWLGHVLKAFLGSVFCFSRSRFSISTAGRANPPYLRVILINSLPGSSPEHLIFVANRRDDIEYLISGSAFL